MKRNHSEFQSALISGAIPTLEESLQSINTKQAVVVHETPQQSILRLKEFFKSLGYHALDFTRISTVTLALLSQSLNQIFAVLKNYHHAPSMETQLTWLGPVLTAISCFLALLVKVLNEVNRTKDSAYEDDLFAIISPAIFFMILDNLGWNRKDVVTFVIVMSSYPVIAYLTKRLTVADSSHRLLRSFNNEDFPRYNVSRIEKFVNATLTASAYFSGLQAIFWVRNREKYGMTVPLNNIQEITSYAFSLVPVVAGYRLTENPEIFNVVAGVSKGMRDGAFAAAALSGISFWLLMYFFDCKEMPCWDSKESDQLSGFIIAAAVLIGLYSALFTRFRFAANHKDIAGIEHNIERAGEHALAMCCSWGTLFNKPTENQLETELLDLNTTVSTTPEP